MKLLTLSPSSVALRLRLAKLGLVTHKMGAHSGHRFGGALRLSSFAQGLGGISEVRVEPGLREEAADSGAVGGKGGLGGTIQAGQSPGDFGGAVGRTALPAFFLVLPAVEKHAKQHFTDREE